MRFFRHLRNSKDQADAARKIGKTSEPERRVFDDRHIFNGLRRRQSQNIIHPSVRAIRLLIGAGFQSNR